tara:strand:- start:1620 stop:1979 length:360 start_codon:yes stop_codon:yes gene_type:complete
MPANLGESLLENNDITAGSPYCQFIGPTIMLGILGTFIWYALTHSPQQGVTRRVTEHPNIDPLPLLSISLLGLAAMIALTKTNSIQNFSLGSLFNKKTGEPENGSKNLEKGSQPSNHKV